MKMTTFRAARWWFVGERFVPFGPERVSREDAVADMWDDRNASGKDIGRYTVLEATPSDPSLIGLIKQ